MKEITILYIALVLGVFSAGYITMENWDIIKPNHTHPYTESEVELIELQSNMIADLNIQNERQDAMLEWMFQTLCNEHPQKCSEAFTP